MVARKQPARQDNQSAFQEERPVDLTFTPLTEEEKRAFAGRAAPKRRTVSKPSAAA